MKRDYSIIGEEFGDLRVLAFEKSVKRSPKAGARTLWRCLCLICGKETVKQRQNIISGNTNDCGCEWGKRAKIARTLNCNTGYVSEILCKGKQLSPNTDLVNKIFSEAARLRIKNKRYSSPKKREIE